MRISRLLSLLKVVVGFALLGGLLLSLESYRGQQLQARRTAEQAALLAAMQSLDNPAVSQLVADWRMVYPEPSEERLEELRDLARQLQAEPGALEAPGAGETRSPI